MEAPEGGKQRRRKIVAWKIRRTPESRRGLRHLVGQQPGFRERAAQADFVLAFEARALQCLREHADRLRMLTVFERRSCVRQRRLKGDGDHAREHTTVRWRD